MRLLRRQFKFLLETPKQHHLFKLADNQKLSDILTIFKFIETQNKHWVKGLKKSVLQAKNNTIFVKFKGTLFQDCWKKNSQTFWFLPQIVIGPFLIFMKS